MLAIVAFLLLRMPHASALDLASFNELAQYDYKSLKHEMKNYYLSGIKHIKFGKPYYDQVQKFVTIANKEQDAEGMALAQVMLVDVHLRQRRIQQAEKELISLEAMHYKDRFFQSQLLFLKAFILALKGAFHESNLLLTRATELYLHDGQLERNAELCEILLVFAYNSRELGENSENIEALEKAKNIAEYLNLNRNYRAQIYHDLGIAYSLVSNLALSMDNLFLALEILQETKIYRLEVSTLNQIAFNKASLDLDDEVIFFYNKALDLLEKLDPEDEMRGEILANVADYYHQKKEYEKAFLYIDKAISFNRSRGAKQVLLENMINWAFFSNGAGKPKDAMKVLLEIEALPDDHWLQHTRLWFQWALAESYFSLGQLGFAKKHIDMAITKGKEFGVDEYLKSIYLLASKIYEQLSIPNTPMIYYKEFVALEKKQQDIKNKALLLNRELSFQRQENKSLESQNQLAKKLLKEEELRRWFLFVGLLISIAFLFAALRQKRIIASQNDTIKKIVNNINEGILLLDSNLKFHHRAFPLNEVLLPKLKTDFHFNLMDFVRALELGADHAAMVCEVIKSCFDMDELQFELNQYHLPKMVHLASASKYLEIDWNPILHDGLLQQFVIVFRDISKRLELEHELYQENRKQGFSLTLLKIFNRDKASLPTFFASARTSIDNLNDMVRDYASNKKSILSSLHTLKGNSRSIQLAEFADSIHNLETALKSEGFDPVEFQKAFDQFRDNFYLCESIYTNLFEASIPQYSPRHDLYIGHSTILTGLLGHLEENGLKLRAINFYCDLDAVDRLLVNDITNIMTHAITNALDHGYILPLKQNRSSISNIDLSILLTKVDGGYHVEIGDQGIGLNRDIIKKICEQKNFTPEPGEDIYQVLFMDEVSTSETVSKTSGRGVGAAAIRDISHRNQGWAKISPNAPKGTKLEVFIPDQISGSCKNSNA